MNLIDLGMSKRARPGYSFDDVALAPTRRTRDLSDISLDWQIDAYKFSHPIVAAPMDSVVSPDNVGTFAAAGGLAVINLDGLWTRYEDPESAFDTILSLPLGDATARLQELYAAPIIPELIVERVAQMRATGATVAGSLSPQNTALHWETVARAGIDIFVIRGTTVSAEHVSTTDDTLNLKEFVFDLDVPVIVGGCATYRSALHLMRAGATGVLVGFGGGASHTTHQVLGIRVPMASAVADVAEARRDYLDESGGRYVHVIADGAMGSSGAMVKALACGADAVMVGSPLARASDAPGRGRHWGMEAAHPELPRGELVEFGARATLAEILTGPSFAPDGTMNLVGAIRRAMATCGYRELKEFQRVEVFISR